MLGDVVSIWRHPVKGLTPEPLEAAALAAGQCFPCDRKWAVEVGPSGFDPSNPKHVSKQRFTVLARFPELARVRTRYDDETGRLHVGDASGFGVEVDMAAEDGRAALARFLKVFIGPEVVEARLQVLEAPGAHRFMDSPSGFVSAINLASIRDLERRLGRAIDPRRFRANIYYDGPAPWAEDGLARGEEVMAGSAHLSHIKPIERCVATHVDPDEGVRDIDIVDGLRRNFGRITLGDYFAVAEAGAVARGDRIFSA
jgi:uncharacterized protein YcbX